MTGSSPNWLLGNTVGTVQWESGNAGSAFPFEDDSTPEGFPTGVVLDACVVVPDSISGRVVLSCLHVGPSLASVMFSVGGEPALECHVLKDSFEPFVPVRMSPVIEGVCGFVTFGDIRFGDAVMVRDMVPLSESCVVRPHVGPLRRFVQPERMESASGSVGFELPDGVSAKIDENGDETVVTFSLSQSLAELVRAPCDTVDRSAGSLANVTNINGVVPDSKGRIAIVFRRESQK